MLSTDFIATQPPMEDVDAFSCSGKAQLPYILVASYVFSAFPIGTQVITASIGSKLEVQLHFLAFQVDSL